MAEYLLLFRHIGHRVVSPVVRLWCKLAGWMLLNYRGGAWLHREVVATEKGRCKLWRFIPVLVPVTSPMITFKNLQGTKVDHSTPWGKIFTSMSFLSLMIVHCAHNWGFWTLLTKIPSYMKTVLEFDIKQVSWVAIKKLGGCNLGFGFIYMHWLLSTASLIKIPSREIYKI